VWEVSCAPPDPILDLDSEEIRTRDTIVSKLMASLTGGELDGWIDFREWLDKIDDTELFAFYDDIVVKLRGANGYVAAYNVAFSYLTGSHNNALLLGSASQAAGAIFYICPYMGKKKKPLLESLIVLKDAVEQVQQYPSSSRADVGTPGRNAKHVMERVLNKMNLKMELSVYQNAGKLLHLPCIITSDKYAYIKPAAEMSAASIVASEAQSNRLWEHKASCGGFSGGRAGTAVDGLDCLNGDGDVATLLEDCDSDGDDDSSYSNEKGSDDNEIGAERHVSGYEHGCGKTDERSVGDFQAESSPVQDLEPDAPSAVQRQPPPPLPQEATMGRYRRYLLEKGVDGADDIVTFVPDSLLYNNRGKELRHLSRYEMAALCQLDKSPTDAARKRVKVFDLPDGYELRANYAYFLQKKQRTPILTSRMQPHPGAAPPVDSGRLDAWTRDADSFAHYILIVFRPEVDYYDASNSQIVNPYQYTYSALEEWIAELADTSWNLISTWRRMLIDRSYKCLRSTNICKTILLDYRGRNRDLWELIHGQKYRYPSKFRFSDCHTGMDEDVSPAFETPKTLTPAAQQARIRKSASLKQQLLQVSAIFNDVKPKVSRAQRKRKGLAMVTSPLSDVDVLHSVQATQSLVGTAGTDIFSTLSDERKNIIRKWEDQICSSPEASSRSQPIQLTRRQQLVYNIFSDYVEGNRMSLPPVTILQGTAGTGKTTVLRHINALFRSKNIRYFNTSFNHINALMIGGKTTASVIRLNVPGVSERIIPLTMNELAAFRKLTGIGEDPANPVRLICIEEFSNFATHVVSKFSKACQQALGNDEDFGGLPVVYCGDAGQMPPVESGKSLTAAILDVSFWNNPDAITIANDKKAPGSAPGPVGSGVDSTAPQVRPSAIPSAVPRPGGKADANHPFTVGANLFSQQAALMPLDEQQRATDPDHIEFVNWLGNSRPISVEKHLKCFKQLSKADFAGSHAGAWLDGSFLLRTHHEAAIYTHVAGLAYAKHTGGLVVRWALKRSVECSDMDNVEDPGHYEYFVAGAKGSLTAKINTDLGLVNALPIRYQSLIPGTQHDRDLIDDALKKCSGDGDEEQLVTLTSPPENILITIPLESLLLLSPDVRMALAAISVHKDDGDCVGDIVVPVPPGGFARSDKKKKVLNIFDACDQSYDSIVTPHFPLRLSFAMTVNRSQGSTMDKIVIVLSYRSVFNFTYDALYVAFSRVLQRDDIRLLLVGETEEERWKSVAYVESLKPDPSSRSFLTSFPGWTEDNWLTTRYNPRYAAMTLLSDF
jgi:hypothetical protein